MISLPFASLLLLVFGCGRGAAHKSQHISERFPPGLFENATESAGIRFRHTNGDSGQFRFPETFGGGCAFLDYDEDGRLDALLLSCGKLLASDSGPNLALYHNEGTGRFKDVTSGSGLERPLGYAQAVAVGDYDNDGFSDVFVAGYGGCFLFRNHGVLTADHSQTTTARENTTLFEDVTESAGVSDRDQGIRWASGAAFGDYDRDGWLDLFLIRYAKWTPETDKKCPRPDGSPGYCVPDVYDGDSVRLFRNLGGTRFEDVTADAGLSGIRGRGLAVAWLDFDRDDKEDIFVANDLNPNFLLRNLGNGKFREVGAESGAAFGGDGLVASGMGVALGDYDHSGGESLLIPNLNGERFTLLKAESTGSFTYATESAGLSAATLYRSGWGAAFMDIDRDGWTDLVTANGNVHETVAKDLPGITYKEPKGVFLNDKKGGFSDLTTESGAMAMPRAARGMAVGDYDSDGRMDALFINRNEGADLFRGVSNDENHWISIRLVGVKSNRDGAGAKVRVTAGGMRQYSQCRLSSSYASSNDKRLFFGLGSADIVSEVEIAWPSGIRDHHRNLPMDTFTICTEGNGWNKAQPPDK